MPCGAKCTALRERRVFSTTAGCAPPSPPGWRYLHMCSCGIRRQESAGRAATVAEAGTVCGRPCIEKGDGSASLPVARP